jgi:GH24 family phage-related lysozyme (muramidase)
MIKEDVNIKEFGDVPAQSPAQYQPIHHQSINPEFIKYIKFAENGTIGPLQPKHLKIYDVAGVPHIGYGHVVKPNEINQFKNGITQKYADDLLIRDLELAKRNVYTEIKSMFGISIPLNQKQEEMLIDFEFNLGTLRKFPKFTKAVLNKDIDTIKNEYKRTFKDKNGIRRELGRNKLFYDRYLSSPIKENISSTIKRLITEKTLYHGTVVDFIPSIQKNGLMPTVGEFVKTVYAGATDDDIEDYLTDLTFATDKEKLSKSVNAITAQVGAKLGKDFHSVTDEEFKRYGALVIVKDGESIMKHRPEDDENYYGQHPFSVEPGDYYSDSSVEVDYVLTGNKLISFLKRFGEWPRDFGPTSDVKKGQREELIRIALKQHPAVSKEKIIQSIDALTPVQLTQYHAQYKRQLKETTIKNIIKQLIIECLNEKNK